VATIPGKPGAGMRRQPRPVPSMIICRHITDFGTLLAYWS
jgi:hypothetical protein